MFKRISGLIFGLLVLIPSLQLSANLPANLVPANASFIGSVDVAKILSLPIFEPFREELVILETTIGYRLAQLGTISWFAVSRGMKEPAAAGFTKAIPESVLGKGSKTSYQGTTIYTLNDDHESAATKLDGWIVIGNLDGVKAVINAKVSGRSLASTGKYPTHESLATQSRGIFRLSYIPKAGDIAKFKEDFGITPELKDFADDLVGAAIGLDVSSQDLVIKIAALATPEKASATAAAIRMLKMGAQQQFDMLVNMYTAQFPAIGQGIRQTWNSITINAEGKSLVLTFAMPLSLIEFLAKQMEDLIDD